MFEAKKTTIFYVSLGEKNCKDKFEKSSQRKAKESRSVLFVSLNEPDFAMVSEKDIYILFLPPHDSGRIQHKYRNSLKVYYLLFKRMESGSSGVVV